MAAAAAPPDRRRNFRRLAAGILDDGQPWAVWWSRGTRHPPQHRFTLTAYCTALGSGTPEPASRPRRPMDWSYTTSYRILSTADGT